MLLLIVNAGEVFVARRLVCLLKSLFSSFRQKNTHLNSFAHMTVVVGTDVIVIIAQPTHLANEITVFVQTVSLVLSQVNKSL